MTKSALILLLTLSCTRIAFAQTSPEPTNREFEVTGFAGNTFGRDYQFQTRVSGSDQESSRIVGMHYAAGYQAGVRANQNFADFATAELEYSFANQPLRFSNLSEPGSVLDLSHYLHSFSYGVVFSPMRKDKRFRPYFGGGAGTTFFYVSGTSKQEALLQGVGLRDSWEFVFNWGGGVKYLVRDQFAIALDVKDRISRVPNYALPSTGQVINGRYVPAIATQGIMQVWQVNFGFTYQWDGF
jgi:outer membrane protein W